MVGMAKVGAPISLDWMSECICLFCLQHQYTKFNVDFVCWCYEKDSQMCSFWCICLCYLHFVPENPEDGERHLSITLWTPTHAYTNRRWGNPAGTQHNPVWNGWGFRVGTWNVDLLTGRAGEVVEALSERKVDVACIKKHDGKVVVTSSMELKPKDI